MAEFVNANNQIQKLSKNQLVDLILALDLSISSLENQARELKKQQADAERQLMEYMETEEIQSFQCEDGKKVSRADKAFVTTRVDDRQRWFNWLEKIGRSDLIKTDFNKNSLNALIRKIISGKEEHPLPDFLDIEKDIFFHHRIDIKLGNKSLRKAAADAGAEGASDEF